jgi:hypothetical protein
MHSHHGTAGAKAVNAPSSIADPRYPLDEMLETNISAHAAHIWFLSFLTLHAPHNVMALNARVKPSHHSVSALAGARCTTKHVTVAQTAKYRSTTLEAQTALQLQRPTVHVAMSRCPSLNFAENVN